MESAEVYIGPEEHRYYKTKDGRKLPSVTSVMQHYIAPHVKAQDLPRERGTAVHKALEYFDQDRLDFTSLSPQVIGFVRGYEQWQMDHAIKIIQIEQKVIDPVRGYAGRLDRVVAGAIQSDKKLKTIVDMKCGAVNWSSALQTAAYLGDKRMNWGRAVLQLLSDGTYRWWRFPIESNARHFRAFCGALELFNISRSKFPFSP